ncbi:MAG: hypothetical protein R2806_10390 [Saprospiraceae bacterium]
MSRSIGEFRLASVFSSEPLFIPDSIITTDMFLVTPKNILIYATGNVIHLRDLLHLDHAPIQYIAKGAIFIPFLRSNYKPALLHHLQQRVKLD